MKLVSLSAWRGKQLPELKDFLNLHQERVDVFCFQEVYANFGKMLGVFSGFNSFFVPTIKNVTDAESADSNQVCGSVIFVRKDYTVQNYEEIRARNIQALDIVKQEKKYRIINVHGLWNGGPKDDNPERLDQAKHIINVVETSVNPVIVTGDFNLNPDTKSLKMLEDCGLINLINEYGITSTRSELSSEDDRLTDYIFTSPKIKARGFSVPNIAISDHLPLIFEAK